MRSPRVASVGYDQNFQFQCSGVLTLTSFFPTHNLLAHQSSKIQTCIVFTNSHIHVHVLVHNKFSIWERTSQHDYAIVCYHTITLCSNLIRSLGNAGEIEGETEAILLENNIDFTDFSKEITDSLPQLPWSIPKVANPDIHKMYIKLKPFLLERRGKEERLQTRVCIYH